MYRPHLAPAPRQGIILLVVLAMLTLFTIIGISFALYANAAATQARLAREAEVKFKPDMEPEECLSLFLDQLIFDVRDDESGVYSGLRGHSLSRSMYGFDYNFVPATATNPAQITQVGNDVPFIGVGRLHYKGPAVLPDSTLGTGPVDDYKLVNYTYFSSDNFLRDPERYGTRNNIASNRGAYVASANVPYTYPDLNNFWLGAIDGAGNLITPSFHREWLFGDLRGYPGNPYGVAVNPNWTNAVGKYLTTRPRPQENPGFPYSGDRYGDVKNLIGYPGGNDSSWLDIGAPVLTTPDGRKYKMLVAPLIVELDGRINLNAHGNKRTIITPGHASDHGLGPCEVSLIPVLGANDAAGNAEWFNLFNGRTQPTVWGRYGPTRNPLATTTNPLSTIPPVHAYSMLNYDASQTSRIVMPAGTSAFPNFPPGYDNSLSGELGTNPLLYNVFNPFTPQTAAGNVYNRRFSASNMERLLCWQATGHEARRSELEQLLPVNLAMEQLQPATLGNGKPRNLVTTDSGDRNSPGVSPYVFTPTNPTFVRTDGPPTWLTNTVFPPLQAPLPTPSGSEFTTDWRSALAATSGQKLTRLDLNSPVLNGQPAAPLTPYPTLTPNARHDTNANAATYLKALKDRQDMTRQIYLRLLAVAALPPVATAASPTDAELQPRRWLAQLAVNMVDFMDGDDISTPFNFYTATDANSANFNVGATDTLSSAMSGTNPTTVPRYWVFGTELPRVVINEVLAEYTLPQPTVGNLVPPPFENKVWVELFNPMDVNYMGSHTNVETNDRAPVNLGMPALGAGLQTTASIPVNPNAYAAYQVVIADQINLPALNNNVLGLPTTVRGQTSSTDFAPNASHKIGGNAVINGPPTLAPQQFLLLAPPTLKGAQGTIDDPTVANSKSTVPAATPYISSSALQYTSTYSNATTYAPNDTANGLTVLLQRLANPHIPPNNTITSPWYNPYLTIDYIQNVPLHDASQASYTSVGKKQPYASRMVRNANGGALSPDATSLVVNQTGSGTVKHTFGNINNPRSAAYDWLMQADRVVINPLELLHVSQFQPHQLTQKFMLADGTGAATDRFQHAPLSTWYDETHRLYRVFELLEARDRLLGFTTPDGRTTGKININAIWDYATFLALCDPQTTNNFTATDVKAAWDKLIALRSPNVDTAGHHLVGPTSLLTTQVAAGATARLADRPFLGLAAGAQAADPANYKQFPEAQGVNDTLLRSFTGNNVPTDPRLFEFSPTNPVTDHPYIKSQMMMKIFGNVTTRSNVFAVWTTVGFFEVTDDTKRPVQLGAEMGAAEGKAIRHRMFAIVDRSVLANNPNTATKTPFRPSAPPAGLNGLVPHWSLID